MQDWYANTLIWTFGGRVEPGTETEGNAGVVVYEALATTLIS